MTTKDELARLREAARAGHHDQGMCSDLWREYAWALESALSAATDERDRLAMYVDQVSKKVDEHVKSVFVGSPEDAAATTPDPAAVEALDDILLAAEGLYEGCREPSEPGAVTYKPMDGVYVDALASIAGALATIRANLRPATDADPKAAEAAARFGLWLDYHLPKLGTSASVQARRLWAILLANLRPVQEPGRGRVVEVTQADLQKYPECAEWVYAADAALGEGHVVTLHLADDAGGEEGTG